MIRKAAITKQSLSLLIAQFSIDAIFETILGSGDCITFLSLFDSQKIFILVTYLKGSSSPAKLVQEEENNLKNGILHSKQQQYRGYPKQKLRRILENLAGNAVETPV